jgi:UDP-glucose 4-epimerase
MHILVTGGAGFVGSNLLLALSEALSQALSEDQTLHLTSLDNYLSGSKENHVDGVRYIEGNTWDADTIFKDERFDIIFHFGEYSRISSSFDEIDVLNSSILKGTPVILELARKWKSLFIYSATSSSLGNNEANCGLSPYSWMKSKMVEYILHYHTWFGLQYQIVHFFNVYGPKQIQTGKYSTVIGVFKHQYENNQLLTVVSPGTQTRDFVHVNDVVDGLLKVMKTPFINHKWYFNTNTNISIIEIAKLFQSDYVIVPERNGERYKSCTIETDTSEKLHWKPTHTVQSYIQTIVGSKRK